MLPNLPEMQVQELRVQQLFDNFMIHQKRNLVKVNGILLVFFILFINLLNAQKADELNSKAKDLMSRN